MRIATFNCNSLRARLPVISRWIAEKNPDVLCLQETKVTDDDFPLLDIQALGYQAIYRGEKSYNGVAILSRHKIENAFYGFTGAGEDDTRLIAATINSIHIVNTYVPQGTAVDSDKFQYKLGWFGRLRDYFNSRYTASDPLVWVGDFNVAPDPIDVHNPKRLLGSIGYHPLEHQALASVKEWGFDDVFRIHNPQGGLYTFWDYRVRDSVAKGLGWRVDHIWATRALAQKSRASFVDVEPRLWEKPSDHTPLVADF